MPLQRGKSALTACYTPVLTNSIITPISFNTCWGACLELYLTTRMGHKTWTDSRKKWVAGTLYVSFWNSSAGKTLLISPFAGKERNTSFTVESTLPHSVNLSLPRNNRNEIVLTSHTLTYLERTCIAAMWWLPCLEFSAHIFKRRAFHWIYVFTADGTHLNVSDTDMGTSPRKFLEIMIFPLRSMMKSADATMVTKKRPPPGPSGGKQ